MNNKQNAEGIRQWRQRLNAFIEARRGLFERCIYALNNDHDDVTDMMFDLAVLVRFSSK